MKNMTAVRDGVEGTLAVKAYLLFVGSFHVLKHSSIQQQRAFAGDCGRADHARGVPDLRLVAMDADCGVIPGRWGISRQGGGADYGQQNAERAPRHCGLLSRLAEVVAQPLRFLFRQLGLTLFGVELGQQ